MSHAESVDHDDPDAFPRPFGQYLLLENFARGGMGEVYLSKIGAIAGLERYCVLKKLRAELTRDREYVTRFIDEARVVVTLNHANVCHVFDVGRVGEEYYLAMEYVSGRDVRSTLDRCRQKERVMPPATALHLVCETLEALDYAHRRNHPLTGEPLNLVHRDVSPQNVLVSYEGEVKLIDFGLAASKLKVERTQPNVVMGKMAYMAPEQARGDQIDARADLFACGVLAYELLSGERFYEGMTANDIWQVAGKGGFIPRRWGTLDPDIAKHLAKALHPDAKKRFATCGDFREALASHMHWRFPGTGVRGLREVMNELFADEVRKERELLAKFGTVTVAGFRTSFEESASQSVSLARADESGARPALVVRNEQSASASGAPMPSPSSPSRSDPQPRSTSGARDVHRETTRLVVNPDDRDLAPSELTDAFRSKERSTDEADPSTTLLRPRGDTSESPPEVTMRVQRKITSSASDVTSLTPSGLAPSAADDDDPLVVPGSGRGKAAIAAIAAVVAVVVIGFIARGGEAEVVTRPSEPVPSSPVAPVAAELAPVDAVVAPAPGDAVVAIAPGDALVPAEVAPIPAEVPAVVPAEVPAVVPAEVAPPAETVPVPDAASRKADDAERERKRNERKRLERERERELEAAAAAAAKVEKVEPKKLPRERDAVLAAARCACNPLLVAYTNSKSDPIARAQAVKKIQQCVADTPACKP